MSTGRPATRHCAAARRWHNRSRGWRGIYAATAIGVWRAGVAGDRVGAWREPPRGFVAANGTLAWPSPLSPRWCCSSCRRWQRRSAAINDAVNTISAATRAGTSFVFGYLGGGALPFDLKAPGADFILAFQALPIVLVMSVLTTLLFYWRVLPPIVRGMAWLLERTLGVGGAVGLSDRRQHLPRHGRGAAVHPALSGATDPQRTVSGDDRRHGGHRRHRAGALRHAASRR